jgi:WD40 repeat protein
MSLGGRQVHPSPLGLVAVLAAMVSTTAIGQGGSAPAPTSTTAEPKVTEMRPIRELRQLRAVTALAFDSGGVVLLTGSLDGAVRRWNLASGALDGTFRLHRGDVGDVALLEETGMALSTGTDGQLIRFDLRSGKVLRKRQFDTWCLALTQIDRNRAAIGCADLTLHEFEIDSLKTVRTLKLKGNAQYNYPTHLSTVGDGTRLLVGDPFSTVDVASWQASPARRLFSYSAVLSPDGRHLLSGQIGRNAQVFTLDPFAQLAELRAPLRDSVMSSQGRIEAVQDTPLYAVGWSPDGRFAATGGLDRLVRLWDLREIAKPVELARLAGHTDVVTQLVWLQDGKLVTSDLSGAILVWSTATATEG